MYLFLAVLCFHCCMGFFFFFLIAVNVSYSLVAIHELLIAVASLAAERGLQAQLQHIQQLLCKGSIVAAPGLQSTGSVVVTHGLSCSEACGIFLDQELNPCLLHWQTDYLPLSHQGSLSNYILKYLPQINESVWPQKYFHVNVHCNFILNPQSQLNINQLMSG